MRRLIVLCTLLLVLAVSCGDDEPAVTAGSSSTDPTGSTGSSTTEAPATTASTTTAPTTTAPGVDGGAVITGYETSFGMCAGWCRLAVAIDRETVTLVATDHTEGQEATTSGTLTEVGMRRLAEVAAPVAPAELDEVYGCPDCADGGAASLTFASDDGPVTATYDFGGPPPALTGADALGEEILEAMRTCTSTELVTVDDGCTPLRP